MVIEQIVRGIKDAMDEQGIGQKQLAIRSGASQATISRVLSGKLEPKLSTFYGIAVALGVSSDSLLGIGQ